LLTTIIEFALLPFRYNLEGRRPPSAEQHGPRPCDPSCNQPCRGETGFPHSRDFSPNFRLTDQRLLDICPAYKESIQAYPSPQDWKGPMNEPFARVPRRDSNC